MEQYKERHAEFIRTFGATHYLKFCPDYVDTEYDAHNYYHHPTDPKIKTYNIKIYETEEQDYIITSNSNSNSLSELHAQNEWTQIEPIHNYTYTYVKIIINHNNIIENAKKISKTHIPKYIKNEYRNKLKYSNITVYLKDNNYYILSNSYDKYNDKYINNGWSKIYDCDWTKNYNNKLNDIYKTNCIYGTVFAKVIQKR